MINTTLEALKKILLSGISGTQDTLKDELEKHGFEVTQSTVSRCLKKLGAVKTQSPDGESVYRLASDIQAPEPPTTSLAALITGIYFNESMIIVRTSPGSANLVARRLDHFKPGGILGTIAGDDTIFVAPPPHSKMPKVVKDIRQALEN